MADLRQALIWLTEGKKIQNKEFISESVKYLEIWSGKIVDDDCCESQHYLDCDSCWELYEEPQHNCYSCSPLALIQCYRKNGKLYLMGYNTEILVNFCPYCGEKA